MTTPILRGIILGLDGGIKLWQSHILKIKEMMDIVDAMPIRKNEIRNKEK